MLVKVGVLVVLFADRHRADAVLTSAGHVQPQTVSFAQSIPSALSASNVQGATLDQADGRNLSEELRIDGPVQRKRSQASQAMMNILCIAMKCETSNRCGVS